MLDVAVPAGRYLTFVVGDEVFALDIHQINEVLAYRDLTVVPMMPAFVRGVLNLRGRVVPVVDLAARFGRGTTAIGRRTSIVIVTVDGDPGDGTEPTRQDIGVVVDTVNEVVDLDISDIEPPPRFGAGIRPDFIAGMARRQGDFSIVLDMDRILSLEEMAALGKEAARGSGRPEAEASSPN